MCTLECICLLPAVALQLNYQKVYQTVIPMYPRTNFGNFSNKRANYFFCLVTAGLWQTRYCGSMYVKQKMQIVKWGSLRNCKYLTFRSFTNQTYCNDEEYGNNSDTENFFPYAAVMYFSTSPRWHVCRHIFECLSRHTLHRSVIKAGLYIGLPSHFISVSMLSPPPTHSEYCCAVVLWMALWRQTPMAPPDVLFSQCTNRSQEESR